MYADCIFRYSGQVGCATLFTTCITALDYGTIFNAPLRGFVFFLHLPNYWLLGYE